MRRILKPSFWTRKGKQNKEGDVKCEGIRCEPENTVVVLDAKELDLARKFLVRDAPKAKKWTLGIRNWTRL